ncbi:MAG: beta-eliminating lyase-related protein [Pseudomonadota bacterium]
MTTYHFNSDNGAPVCTQVMQALADCNTGVETAYGADRWSVRLNAVYSEFFERECFVFPVATGTAGNGLALGAVTPPYGTIFCHGKAHIVTTECGAPEFYSGGGRMTLLDGKDNKIAGETLDAALQDHGIGNVHHMQASTLSVTQATEAGVTYSLAELQELCEIAHTAGMTTHLDGARFSNAMVHLGASPAEMTWKAGVDVLTFGTTKNGTMNAEAVITFDLAIAKVLCFMHKRAGHLSSKMRYMSAQLLSYLENDLWHANAARANANARRVANALGACPDVKLVHPVHINEVFAIVPVAMQDVLQSADICLRPWNCDQSGQGSRMVMSYCDCEEQIAALEQACRAYVLTANHA